MTAQAETTRRLDRAERELREAGEWIARIKADVAAIERSDDVPLVGTQEAIEIVGLTKTGFAHARRNGRVPEPLITLACGPIWHRETIEQWAATRRAAA